jgi:hypothetical protein
MSGAETLQAPSEFEALEVLHRLGCTDGLPVVIPTSDRVERMVIASGMPDDLELGVMGPNLGSCTVEKLAIAAVMAGCVPDHLPVVIAAARAIMDERFDLTEVQATTHSISPLIIVNGPAAHACGPISGSFGALGPGHRANASIGRAIRLAMINVGGGRSGVSDMALLGHAGKFTMCLAEAEADSPFEPMHVGLGFAPTQSTVTVVGTDAPHSVMAITDADDPSSADRLLTSLALGFANVATNNAVLRNGQAAVAINPDHAALLAGTGHTRSSIAEAIVERAVVPGRDLLRAAGSMDRTAADRDYGCFASPDDLLVFVAGGGGLYSAVFPSWCAGPHRNRAITVEIELDQACAVPWASA